MVERVRRGKEKAQPRTAGQGGRSGETPATEPLGTLYIIYILGGGEDDGMRHGSHLHFDDDRRIG